MHLVSCYFLRSEVRLCGLERRITRIRAAEWKHLLVILSQSLTSEDFLSFVYNVNLYLAQEIALEIAPIS